MTLLRHRQLYVLLFVVRIWRDVGQRVYVSWPIVLLYARFGWSCVLFSDMDVVVLLTGRGTMCRVPVSEERTAATRICRDRR